MPAIDPGKLLSTLSVLLGTHGGIKSQEEVERLVTLMDKFSRKMVSKVVYINILKATKPDVLEKFLSEKGWILVNNWFSESIKACNWPLTLELLKLFHICPMTIDRLRENSETNSPPKLVRQLAHNAPNIEKDVSDLAKEVLDKWMTVIQCPPSNPSNKVPAAPLPTRGNRGLATARAGTAGTGQLSTTPSPTPGDRPDDRRVIVTVFTETVEIVRLLNMQCQALEQQEPQFWNGRGGLADKARIKYEKAAAAAAKKPRVAAVKKAPKLVMKITNPAADNTVDTIVAGAGKDY